MNEGKWLASLTNEQRDYLRDHKCSFCGCESEVRVFVDGLMGDCLTCLEMQSAGVEYVDEDGPGPIRFMDKRKPSAGTRVAGTE